MKRILRQTKNLYILGAVFIFALFAYISYCTPVAGDDWGYALNGMKGNPLVTTYEFYFNWSGRIFSELWGFLIAPNKWLWNILNPMFFTVIFVLIYRIIKPEKNYLVYVLMILAVILSVDDNLRMETYTWIMGTTYIIPLMLSLAYFHLIKSIFELGYNVEISKFKYIVSNILLFYIGLTMENISGVMVGGTLILLVYVYLEKKSCVKLLMTNFIFSLISFMILRLSPGSAYRLANDHQAWAELSLFEKLSASYPKFIEISFLKNDYAVAIFAGVILIFLVSVILNSTKDKKIAYVSVLFQLLTVFVLFSFVLNLDTTVFSDPASLFNMIYWPLYVLDVILIMLLYLEDDNKLYALYFLIIAGTSNLIMLYSPIFGARSSVYFVFYLIVVSGLIMKEINLNRIVLVLFAVGCLFIVADRTNEYIYKYRLVNSIQQERLVIYQYYRDHPEDTDVWIPRMPVFSVHASDIEPDDLYHMRTFKEYYKLPQDYQNIHFYWKESY